MDDSITVLLRGVHVVSENHRYASRRQTMRQGKLERRLAYYTLVEQVGNAWAAQRLTAALVISLTRIAPRLLDGDGLSSSLKHIRDGIADYLIQNPGQGHRYDDSPRFTWRYAQRRGAVREYAVGIRLEEAGHAMLVDNSDNTC